MGIEFKILDDIGLVYVQYHGIVTVQESARVFGQYAQHPLAKPGQKQLIDFERVTDYQTDFVELLKLQMRKADVFLQGSVQTLMVYYAPTDISQKLGQMVVRSWAGIDGIVANVLADPSQAIEVLGIRDHSLEDLRSRAAQMQTQRPVN